MRDRHSFRAKELLGKRPIKRGDTILVSEPFAYVINNQMRGQYCDYCFTSHRNRTFVCCKECKFVWYCDDMCRFTGQNVHKWECAALKRISPREIPAFTRLLARVMYRLKDGGDKYVETYRENKGRKFKDLMNHYRDIKEDKDRMKDVHGLIEELKEFTGDEKFPNESDFIGIYGRVLVNRYCLMDGFHTPIGSGVYLSATIFDHSCVPNAYPSFEKTKLVIRSLVDWEELDLTKVFISYIDIDATKQQRISLLRSHWYFICQCPLCSSNTRDLYENCIKCENPMCGELIQVPEKPRSQFSCREAEPILCSECKCTVDEDTLSEYQSIIAFTRHRLKGIKEENPCFDTCISVLERQSNLIPSLNVWKVRTLDYAFNACFQRGVWSRAMEYGKNNLEGLTLMYGAEHPTLGLFLLKLSKVFMFMHSFREGIKYGEEAKKILTVGLGPNHSLIIKELKFILDIANENVEILLERRIAAKKENEHHQYCKHCGRKKGELKQTKEKDSANINKREITTMKNGEVLSSITKDTAPKIKGDLVSTNSETAASPEKGDVVTITNGDTEIIETTPKNNKKMCKFAVSGETTARLSKRVLDYLVSLQDF